MEPAAQIGNQDLDSKSKVFRGPKHDYISCVFDDISCVFDDICYVFDDISK